MTNEEIAQQERYRQGMRRRWEAESEGDVELLTPEQEDELLSRPGAIDLRPKSDQTGQRQP